MMVSTCSGDVAVAVFGLQIPHPVFMMVSTCSGDVSVSMLEFKIPHPAFLMVSTVEMSLGLCPDLTFLIKFLLWISSLPLVLFYYPFLY